MSSAAEPIDLYVDSVFFCDGERVVGMIHPYALHAYARGELDQLPVLTVDVDELLVRYYPVAAITGMETRPKSLANLEDLYTSPVDESIGLLEERLGSLVPELPVVPVQESPDAGA